VKPETPGLEPGTWNLEPEPVTIAASGGTISVIKDLLPRQVVCTERTGKGKSCHGGLKWYHPFASYYNEPDPVLLEEIKQEFPEDEKLILLKCETCRTVYRLPEVLKEKFQQLG
jgi:hypothetical protein